VVLAWDRNVNRPIEPKPGRAFGRLVIKFCYTGEAGGPVSFRGSPGQYTMVELAYSFSILIRLGRYLSPHQKSYQPELAAKERALLPGECVRGYIVFNTPAGKRPILAEFNRKFGAVVVGPTGWLHWRI
jgi:hypothetical protein